MLERIPIIKIGDALIVSVQGDVTDQLAETLQQDLADRIVQTGAHGVMLEISSLPVVDSFMGRMLATIASTARILDADTVIVGMQPEVAITIVELGLPLQGIRTALNVEKGMALIERGLAERMGRAEVGRVAAPAQAGDDAAPA